MITKKNIHENFHVPGTKGMLAPSGIDLINKRQERIYVIHLEIAAHGAFFRNLNNCDFSHEELYGVSLTLIRISKRLKSIHSLLDHLAAQFDRQE